MELHEMDHRRPAPSLQPAESPRSPEEVHAAPRASTWSPLLSDGPQAAQHVEGDLTRGLEQDAVSNDGSVEEKAALAGHRTPRRPASVLQRLERLQYQSWGWEVLTLVVALCCQVAIVAILIVMHDQPLDRWTAAVSINAVIATLTTTAKSMTLLSVGSCISQLKWVHFKTRPRVLARLDVFEETSRGPLGAAKMVFCVRDWLPLFGAAIVLLALAVDTFAQQLVAFEPQDVPQNDSEVLFGVTQNYSASARSNGATGLRAVDLGNADDIDMQGAIMRGLYGIQSTPQFKCSSRCNWPGSYTTLGFETRCQNVTQALIGTRQCTKSEGPEVFTLCNMTTPGNLSLSSYMDATHWQTTVDVATRHLVPQREGAPFRPDFLQVAVFRVPRQYNQNDGTSNPVGEEAIECTLRLAAWEYTNLSASGNNFTAAHTRRIALGESIQRFSTLPGQRSEFYTFPTQDAPARNVTIRDQDWSAISDYLTSPAFTGNITIGLLTTSVNHGIRLPLATGNMTATLERMARSMTEYVRAGPNAQMVAGQRLQPVVFVRVQGAWLTVPLVVQIAAIALLCCTAIQSRPVKGIPLWKSSSLALLFASHDGTSGAIILSKDKPEDLVDFAESVKAKTD